MMNSEKILGLSGDLSSLSTSGISLPVVSLLGSILLDLNVAVKGLFPSNISMNGVSFRWYMALTPFETFFLGFIIFMVFVLRYIEILPINLNNWIHGDPTGRKKRSIHVNGTTVYTTPTPNSLNCLDELSESAFELIIKLDQEECFRKAVCVIGRKSNNVVSNSLKFGINMIKKFKRLSKLRSKCKKANISKGFDLIQDAMYCEDSETPQMNLNAARSYDKCAKQYSLCPATDHEILDYLDIIFKHLGDL